MIGRATSPLILAAAAALLLPATSHGDGGGGTFFPRECGKCPNKPGGQCIPKVQLKGRIVGGSEAASGTMPWQVTI